MYTLTLRRPDGTETTHELGEDQGLVLGRDAVCDVQLESKKVSRRHARFYTEGGRLFLEDLGSQNGTFVGGAKIDGVTEVRPGPPVEVGEFVVHVRRADARVRGGLAAASDIEAPDAPAAKLKGLGESAGREIALAQRSAVGREPGVQVFIDNDSVSRRHAELRSEAGVWVVRDLGSSNGTFVNEKKLAPNLDERLRTGDKLRFGETHWQLAADVRAPAPAPGLDLRKKLILAVAVLGFVVAAVIALRPPKPPPDTGPVADADPAAEALARGQAALDADRFEEAKKAFQEALEADPFSSEARLLLRKAGREIDAAKAVAEARTKADVGRDAEALELLFQIDTDSRFFAQARLTAQALAQGLMRTELARCRSAGRRGDAKAALESCGRYLDYACHQNPDDDALKALRAAEARERGREAWTCPVKLAPWLGSGTRGGGDTARDIAARYPGKDLRDAVTSYVAGELDNARRSLMRAGRGPDAKAAAAVSDAMAIVDSRFKAGQSAFQRRDLAGMEESFRVALEADAKIVPATVRSFYGSQMAATLAREYYASGRAKFEKGSYPEAWDDWSRGLEYQKNDSSLLDGLAKLEKVAEGLLAEAADCETLQKVQRITRGPPSESPSHARARELLAKNCE